MNITAKEMHNAPGKAYREADKGETVIINHDRYPDKVFELTARERNPLPLLANSRMVITDKTIEFCNHDIKDEFAFPRIEHFVNGHFEGITSSPEVSKLQKERNDLLLSSLTEEKK